MIKRYYSKYDHLFKLFQQFLIDASDKIQALLQLQTVSQQEIEQMVIYFGESPSKVDIAQIFKVFSEFVNKFEVFL